MAHGQACGLASLRQQMERLMTAIRDVLALAMEWTFPSFAWQAAGLCYADGWEEREKKKKRGTSFCRLLVQLVNQRWRLKTRWRAWSVDHARAVYMGLARPEKSSSGDGTPALPQDQ